MEYKKINHWSSHHTIFLNDRFKFQLYTPEWDLTEGIFLGADTAFRLSTNGSYYLIGLVLFGFGFGLSIAFDETLKKIAEYRIKYPTYKLQ